MDSMHDKIKTHMVPVLPAAHERLKQISEKTGEKLYRLASRLILESGSKSKAKMDRN